jgi:hypothetical protein
VVERYNEIEGELLKRFYAFARDRRERNWIHWNMRNIVYGFEHLEHRYRTITGEEPPSIPVEVRVNLNDALKVRYGSDYAADPRMKTLMLLNGLLPQGFLTGEEEAEAFKNREFVRLNSSTICKVNFFHHVIENALRGKLRTAGKTLANRIDRVLESRTARIWALSGTTLGLSLGIYNVVKLIGFFF